MSKNLTLILLSVPLITALSLPVSAQNNAISLAAGSSQSVTTAVDVIPSAGPITVELWVKVPSAMANDNLQHAFVYEGAYGTAFYLGIDGLSGHITAGDFWDGGLYGETNTFMPLDQWVHLAFVGDMTQGDAVLYVNGTSVDSKGLGEYTFNGNDIPFQLGLQGDLTTYVDAQIKNVRVWNVKRSQRDIKSSMFDSIPSTTTGLLASYTMNESSTTTLHNGGSSGSAADGTLHGGITRSASPIQPGQNSIAFNGTTSQVDIQPSASDAYNLAGGGTVEAWVYPTTLDGSNSTIIGLRGGGLNNWSFHLSSTAIQLQNNTTSGSIPATIPLNVWTHLAFVNSGSNTIVYENASPLGTITGVSFNNNSGLPLTFGMSKYSGADSAAFRGRIDEVRIWNTQRSMADITATKDNYLTGTESGLIGEWSFDQGIDGGDNSGLLTVPDMTDNANNASLTSFALSGGSSNFIAHSSLTPLPVTLTQFTVIKRKTEALLQWQTATEQNSRDFIIQRASDGIHYTNIGSVAAAGDSKSLIDYSYVDDNPIIGTNYYRLLQTDLDGKFTYSPVKILLFSTTGNLVWYSTGSHAVEVYLQQGTNEQYVIADISGRTIRKGQLSNGKTSLSRMPAGVYFVKVITRAGQTADTKIVLY